MSKYVWETADEIMMVVANQTRRLRKRQKISRVNQRLRNRIVHDYGNVDLKIVFETLKYDIPDLFKMLCNE